MPTKTWKAFELAVAKYFGGWRTGPMQSKAETDVRHEKLHVQCKHSKRIALVNVWDEAKQNCKGKIPIVAVKQKGRHEFWLLVHSDDLLEVAEARKKVHDQETWEPPN